MPRTGLLRANGVEPLEAAGLVGACTVPFLLDEVLVGVAVAVAVATMRATRVTERHGALLELVAGVAMLALAGVVAVGPALMDGGPGSRHDDGPAGQGRRGRRTVVLR